MDKALEKAKQAVAEFNSGPNGDYLGTMKALVGAIDSARQSLKKNTAKDQAAAVRIARTLDDLLDTLPQARTLPDGHGLPHLHSGKQAEEHIQRLYDHLRGILRGLEEKENRKVAAWLQLNSVLADVHKAAAQGLPKEAYVLLFTASAEGKPELMLRGASESQVFTRFRPQTFANRNAVLKEFIDKPQITGAAVISGNDLLLALGALPSVEGKDQIRVLRSLSHEEASKPLTDFIEANPVLKELNQLAYRRKLPNNGYILLFSAPEGKVEEIPPGDVEEQLTEILSDPAVESAEPAMSTEEPVSVAEDASTNGEEIESAGAQSETDEPDDDEDTDESDGDDDADESNGDDEDAGAEADEPGSAGNLPASDEPVGSELERVAEAESPPANRPIPRLVNKVADDGRIITRFRPAEFNNRQELFERYRLQPKIVGAAVIRERELLRTIGYLPPPAVNQSQVDFLLKLSSQALDKPALDFLAENEVLNSLHQMANGPHNPSESFVVLFVQNESGSPTLYRSTVANRQRTRFSISDFRLPRSVHDQFSKLPKIVGASIIGEQQSFTKKAGGSDGKPGKGMTALSRQVVLSAFGRTPLKAGLVATEENFKRLGIELPEEQQPIPMRPPLRPDRKRHEKPHEKPQEKKQPRRERRPRNKPTDASPSAPGANEAHAAVETPEMTETVESPEKVEQPSP